MFSAIITNAVQAWNQPHRFRRWIGTSVLVQDLHEVQGLSRKNWIPTMLHPPVTGCFYVHPAIDKPMIKFLGMNASNRPCQLWSRCFCCSSLVFWGIPIRSLFACKRITIILGTRCPLSAQTSRTISFCSTRISDYFIIFQTTYNLFVDSSNLFEELALAGTSPEASR